MNIDLEKPYQAQCDFSQRFDELLDENILNVWYSCETERGLKEFVEQLHDNEHTYNILSKIITVLTKEFKPYLMPYDYKKQYMAIKNIIQDEIELAAKLKTQKELEA